MSTRCLYDTKKSENTVLELRSEAARYNPARIRTIYWVTTKACKTQLKEDPYYSPILYKESTWAFEKVPNSESTPSNRANHILRLSNPVVLQGRKLPSVLSSAAK